MTQKRIAMIAGQSLLVQGMANRLPGNNEGYDLKVINPQEEDWKQELTEVSPHVIVLDAKDPHIQQICPLTDLIWSMPDTTVMLLNSEFSELQVISSRRFPIADSEALLERILAPAQES